jgi:hypothetical protein
MNRMEFFRRQATRFSKLAEDQRQAADDRGRIPRDAERQGISRRHGCFGRF